MKVPTLQSTPTSSLPIIQPSSSSSGSFASAGTNIAKQILSIITNSSIIVKSLSIFILIGYFLTYTDKLIDYLCVIPGKLLPPNFWIWTLLTHSFIETNIIQTLIDMFVILLYSKMLEPLWGTRECILFYILVTSIVALCTTCVYFIQFTITFKETLLFNSKIHGLGGLIGAFSVAIKQIMPDTVLLNVGVIQIKQDNLPLLFILLSLIVCLIDLIDSIFVCMILFGVIVSWIYLRFYQKHKNGTRGDSSNSFSFASFFPSIVQPFVAIISNTIFDILVRIKICKKPPKRYNVGAPSQITINLSNIPNLDTDAERRRQKALKALKERLNKSDSNDNGQWVESNEALLKQATNTSQNQTASNASSSASSATANKDQIAIDMTTPQTDNSNQQTSSN